jgi:citrate lyase alpha subunit
MGKPEPMEKSSRVIGISEYRDGTILDYIYAVK